MNESETGLVESIAQIIEPSIFAHDDSGSMVEFMGQARRAEALRKAAEIEAISADAIERLTHDIERHLSILSEKEGEIERLTRELERLHGNPGDFRYWEGRFRDEEKARLTAEAQRDGAYEECARIAESTFPTTEPSGDDIDDLIADFAANDTRSAIASAIRAAKDNGSAK